MRLSLLMLAALAPAVPALAAETPELQRAVGAPQAVGAVHTLRQIPEACARLEGAFTGDAAAPYRFSAVRTSEQCQPRARFVDYTKSGFTGRSAALAERESGPKRRFVVMEVADADTEVVGYESIMKEGAAVGYVTSGAYGHCIGRSLAAGYVPAALARAGARFEIDILGEMRTATVHLEPLYDPQGLRLRS